MNYFAKPSQKTGVFVDTQNIYHSARNFYQSNVNFGKIIDYVVAGRELVRAVAYVIKSDLNQKEISFFEALINKGIELRIKDLLVFNTGEKKADWDVGITVDAIRIAERLDVVILITGDGDFISLVEYLKNKGNQVEVAGFGQNTATKLKESADFFYDLDGISQEILIKKK